EEYLRKVGGQTTADRREIDREGRKAAGLKQKEAPSRALIEEAVAHIRNDELPYDDWIKVGLALYAALGTEGRGLWETWSAEASKNDAAYTAEKWDSFANVRTVTVGTLFWLARQNGWRAEGTRWVREARAASPAVEAEEDEPGGDGRPVIRIFAGFLHDTVDMAEGALMQAGLGYYQRGSMVVRPDGAGGSLGWAHCRRAPAGGREGAPHGRGLHPRGELEAVRQARGRVAQHRLPAQDRGDLPGARGPVAPAGADRDNQLPDPARRRLNPRPAGL
ncbi:MAG: PriCT-2 domain-containing protein, partial [Hyphomonas sp.]